MNFGIWKNVLKNDGTEIDYWKKRQIVDSIADISNALEYITCSENEVLHIHNEWNDENITSSVLKDVADYRELKRKISEIENKYW